MQPFSTTAQAATTAYFTAHPLAISVLVTSDGNCFTDTLQGENQARNHSRSAVRVTRAGQITPLSSGGSSARPFGGNDIFPAVRGGSY